MSLNSMESRRPSSMLGYSHHAKKAAMETLLVVTLFLVVVKVSSVYNGGGSGVDYHRVAVFSALFAFLSFILRITKSSMSHILVNAIYFKLGSIFAKEFVGDART